MTPQFQFQLKDYQWDGVTHMVTRPSSLMVWGMGTGKSHLAYASACVMLGEGMVDRVLVVCEANKMVEWPPDFGRYTNLGVGELRGSPASRVELARRGGPPVLVGTYETIRNDAVVKPSKRSRSLNDGPLIEALTGQRVAVLYDEVTKLSNRGSGVYRAHERMLSRLRKAADVYVVGLTGTPVERSIESVFNYCRLLAPDQMPTVAEFDKTYVVWRDQFDVPRKFRHIDESDRFWPKGEDQPPTFMERLAPMLSVKSSHDPEVIDQFPRLAEPEPIFVPLTPAHRKFYDALDEMAAEDDPETARRWFNLLRQVAVWPEALRFSEGEGHETLAQRIVASVGVDFLRGLGSPKVERIAEDVGRIVDQGDQAILFTFFGQSVLRLVADRMEEFTDVAQYHGAMSLAERRRQVERFRSGEARILVASDAAARGINLPEATYVINIDPPTKHSIWDQRRGRAHRVDSTKDAVWTRDYISLGTIEEAVMGVNLQRQRWGEQIEGDAMNLMYQSAAQRRAAINQARERVERSAAA